MIYWAWLILAGFIGFALSALLNSAAQADDQNEIFFLKQVLRNILQIDIKDSTEAILEAKRKARGGLK